MTEDKPHTVFRCGEALGIVFPTYMQAYAYWLTVNHHKAPHFIESPTGRVIDPSTPIVDVSE